MACATASGELTSRYHRPDRRCNPHRHLLDGIAYHPPSGAVLLPPGSTPPCVCLSTIEPSTSCRRPSERILSPFRLKPPGAVPLIAPLAGLRLNFVSPSSLRSSTALVLIPPIFFRLRLRADNAEGIRQIMHALVYWLLNTSTLPPEIDTAVCKDNKAFITGA